MSCDSIPNCCRSGRLSSSRPMATVGGTASWLPDRCGLIARRNPIHLYRTASRNSLCAASYSKTIQHSQLPGLHPSGPASRSIGSPNWPPRPGQLESSDLSNCRASGCPMRLLRRIRSTTHDLLTARKCRHEHRSIRPGHMVAERSPPTGERSAERGFDPGATA